MKMNEEAKRQRIYTMSFARVYPLYLTKAERKGRTKAEVDAICCWLLGYSPAELAEAIKNELDFEALIKQAPKLNPLRSMIKGVVCGVRVEDIENPIVREVRYLDKLIDELTAGKPMEKILRKD